MNTHLDDVILKAQIRESKDAQFESDILAGIEIMETVGRYNSASDDYNKWLDYMISIYEITEVRLAREVRAYREALATPNIRLRGKSL